MTAAQAFCNSAHLLNECTEILREANDTGDILKAARESFALYRRNYGVPETDEDAALSYYIAFSAGYAAGAKATSQVFNDELSKVIAEQED